MIQSLFLPQQLTSRRRFEVFSLMSQGRTLCTKLFRLFPICIPNLHSYRSLQETSNPP